MGALIMSIGLWGKIYCVIQELQAKNMIHFSDCRAKAATIKGVGLLFSD